MGAATEAKSTGQIKEIFGGRVESFRKPPRDVQARGRKPGQVYADKCNRAGGW